MPTVRNSYGKSIVGVGGTMIAPRRIAIISDEAWDAWLQHSGNQRNASMYLEVITGGETEDQLNARDEGQAFNLVGGEGEALVPSDRARLIDAAVEAIYTDANPVDLVQSGVRVGKPRLDVVRERTGLADVSAAELDASVARYGG